MANLDLSGQKRLRRDVNKTFGLMNSCSDCNTDLAASHLSAPLVPTGLPAYEMLCGCVRHARGFLSDADETGHFAQADAHTQCPDTTITTSKERQKRPPGNVNHQEGNPKRCRLPVSNNISEESIVSDPLPIE